MSVSPTKYVPIEFSVIGVSSLLLSQLRANDTISTLWDKVSGEPQVRTFDRYAEALTLLFAANLIDLRRGVLIRRSETRS